MPEKQKTRNWKDPKTIIATILTLWNTFATRDRHRSSVSNDKRLIPAITLLTNPQTNREVAAQASQNPETPASEEPSSSTLLLVPPDAGKKETSSPWIENYKMGSGKDKINVRIFKEPTTEPVIPETQEEVRKRPVDILALRLKTDLVTKDGSN